MDRGDEGQGKCGRTTGLEGWMRERGPDGRARSWCWATSESERGVV